MSGLRHHFQIGVIVVPLVSVLMVDDLPWKKFPAKHFFRFHAVHVPAFVLDIVVRAARVSERIGVAMRCTSSLLFRRK